MTWNHRNSTESVQRYSSQPDAPNRRIAAVTQQRLSPIYLITRTQGDRCTATELCMTRSLQPTAWYINTIVLTVGLIDIQDILLGGGFQMLLWRYSDACAGTKLSRG